MTKWSFISKPRLIFTGILSALLVFYLLNFIPRNINIVASRSFGGQLFDYFLNFVIFFLVIYIISCLLTFAYQKLSKYSK